MEARRAVLEQRWSEVTTSDWTKTSASHFSDGFFSFEFDRVI